MQARLGMPSPTTNIELRKAGAHSRVLGQPLAQSVKTLRYFLTGMSGHILCAGVNLDARYDTRVGYDFDQRSTIFPGLTDGLIIKDDAADGLTQTRSGQNQLPIAAPHFVGLRNPDLFKTLVTGVSTLIHGQKAFTVGNH